MGQPLVSSNTFWAVYLQLIQGFRAFVGDPEMNMIVEEHRDTTIFIEQDEVEVISGLRELRNGDIVVGEQDVGGDGQRGVPHIEYALFTDDEGSTSASSSS
jgi:hypothetical protein